MDNNKNDMWVIGIGASAGGLEALTQFVSILPNNFPASIIIAQHLAPHAKSMMVELLARKSKLKITQAVNGLALEPNTIIIVPPNYDLVLNSGRVQLMIVGDEPRPKPSVDKFFQSLAKEFTTKSMGIILSGTGSDGSEGVAKIKELGGLTFSQDSTSSKYDGMPNSAALTGIIDFVGTPQEIANRITDIILKDENGEILPEIASDNTFKEILNVLKDYKSLDFSLYKPSTILRRLDKRMKFVGITSMEEYKDFLIATPPEADELLQEMLISVTNFFRDPESFQAIKEIILKILKHKKEGEDLRVWIAGCATGEEAVTFAIIISELLETSKSKIDFKIFASDIDHEAILHARKSVYKKADVIEHIGQELADKYFNEKNSHYEVKKTIRDRIVYARQDMINHPPFVKIDLISCRNVLIYFKLDLQQKIFDIFHYALNQNGYLFLGKSESLPQGNNYFRTFDKNAKIFQKSKSTKSNYPIAVSLPVAKSVATKDLRRETPSVESFVLKEVLKAHQISAAIVDEDWNVLQIFGDVKEFLSLSAGLADFKITNLLPKNIASELHLILRKIQKDNLSHKGREHSIDTVQGKKNLSISVGPVEGSAGKFIITFELSALRSLDIAEAPIKSTDINDMSSRIIELEHDLMASRENLQAVVEELSVSNEELQSVNEEMSSTNEELQASNEELETTNEELQSTNEELTTLNEELNVKSHELRLSNSSLENIQSSIGSPLVVIDSKLRIVRFNQLAHKIFTLNNHSVGKLITNISSNAEIEDFEQLIKHTINSGETSQSIVITEKRSYQFQIQPSKDELGKIIGAILIFFDNTELIEAEKKLTVSQQRVRSIIDGSPALIALKDSFGFYLTVNKAFLSFFNLEEKNVLGKTDVEIFNDHLATQFRDLDLEVLLRKSPSETQDKITFNNRSHIFLASRFPLFNSENNKHPYALGIVWFDVTEQMTAIEALESSEARYRALIEDQAVFVTRFDANGVIAYVNNPFLTFFGGSQESVVGKKFIQYVDIDKRLVVENELNQISTSNPVQTIEHTYKAVNAPIKWIRWILRGIFSRSGMLTEIQAVGFDITEMKIKSDELQEKEKIYGSILSYSSDFLFVYKVLENNVFELESFNRSAETNYINTNNAYVGKTLKDFVDPEKYAKVLSSYQNCLKFKKPQIFEETIEFPTGSKNFQTTLVPVFNNLGEVDKIAAVSRDISKFKQVEFALREEKKLADSASQSKSDFLASMSHELRTPLNVILGMSELISTTNLDEDQARYADSIRKSGKMLLSLIEDVLDLSKIESGKITFERNPFSLKNLANEMFDAFEAQAKNKGLELIIDCDVSDTHRILGDELRIRQVVVNLLSNAIKFTSHGSVTLKIVEDTSKPLVSRLKVEVIDTGMGIPEEAFNKLFTRFTQADTGHTRKYGGTGLGLAISKQLIELMHGHIGFSSEYEAGSTFWFELELSRTQSAPKKTPQDIANIISKKLKNIESQKILIVDDYVDSHSLMKAFLARLGHEAHLMSSGQMAIDSLSKGDEYDLIFMDVQMPEMDGMTATKKIRSLKGIKHTPIIALTANVMKGLKEEAIEAGMDDFLIKPVSIVALKEKIDHWKV